MELNQEKFWSRKHIDLQYPFPLDICFMDIHTNRIKYIVSGQFFLFFKKFLGLFPLLFIIFGCSKTYQTPLPDSVDKAIQTSSLPAMGFTIQAGAFSRINNALNLTRKLESYGLDPYYFFDGKLYKIRFGNFAIVEQASLMADNLKKQNIIEEYYIVEPDSFSYKKHLGSENLIRDILVNTAENFIGIPYKWGGQSEEEGFDCSGLTMVVYKLVGLDLPRTSRLQFNTGKAVNFEDLKPGDLVFFSTGKKGRVSHVGIYKENNSFIHAPSKGKNIKVSNLDSKYFSKRFIGARSYL